MEVRYKVSYITKSLLPQEIEIFHQMKTNEELRSFISSLGLPLDVEESVIRDVIFVVKESQEFDYKKAVAFLAAQDKGFVGFSSWDRL